MKHIMFSIVGAAILFASISLAQESTSNPRRFTEERLKQTKQSLANALENNSPGIQASGAATIRQLAALLPEESFSCFVIPLMRIVKNEDAGVPVRVLAVLALHDLRSAMGDFAIKGVAARTECTRLQHLCAALTMKRMQEQQLARSIAQGGGTEIANR